MRKLLSLLSIFAIVLSCSSDETSTPITPPPAPIVKYTITLSAGEGGTVSNTGGEYEAGQTVNVTATPQGEYLFKDWSDGNTDATRTITVSSNSTLTANFEKRKYPLTVNIEGEGEVLEEIVNAGRTTDYDSGTTVKLTAVPLEGWEFVAWTGDIESTEESVQILIGESKEVTATFENNLFIVTHIPDYSKPSYYTRIPFPQNVKTGTYREFSNWHPPLEAVVLDYNKDGYLDIIDNQSDYGVFTRNNILFLQGTSSGKLEIDSNNSYRHPGLIHGRKGLTGDYNGDGWPDVFFIGHGYDLQDGNPRNEYPIMLLNNQGKDFEYRAFESVVGFFHTGASGDIDNDGDLDILLIDGTKGVENSYIFINDGTGDFLAIPLDQYQSIPSDMYDSFFQKWTVELNDIDKNGYLDIIIAGAPDTYGSTAPTIMLNSSNGFTSKIELPKEPVYKLVVDIDFYDFDGDGIDELILNRTPLNYISYKVTIHSLTTDEYLTTTYFNNNDFTGQTSDKWMYWISIIEKDGELYLKGDDMYTPHQWIFEDGKFKKTKP